MTYTLGRYVTHCPFCGARYLDVHQWPRDCPGCGETNWANPLPVAVALLPVEHGGRTGLVVVRRDIEPCRGELALPGGYMEVGETWQEASVRELKEETGLVASAEDVVLFGAHSAELTLNLFALLPPRPARDLPEPVATEEATEWLVLHEPSVLAFPTHTEVVREYFAAPGSPPRPLAL